MDKQHLPNFRTLVGLFVQDVMKMAKIPSGDNFDLSTSGVEENKNQYIVRFEMPGIKRRDIKINVDGNIVAVHVDRKANRNLKHIYEVTSKSYSGVFSAPTSIDAKNMNTLLKQGILTLTIPKKKRP